MTHPILDKKIFKLPRISEKPFSKFKNKDNNDDPNFTKKIHEYRFDGNILFTYKNTDHDYISGRWVDNSLFQIMYIGNGKIIYARSCEYTRGDRPFEPHISDVIIKLYSNYDPDWVSLDYFGENLENNSQLENEWEELMLMDFGELLVEYDKFNMTLSECLQTKIPKNSKSAILV